MLIRPPGFILAAAGKLEKHLASLTAEEEQAVGRGDSVAFMMSRGSLSVTEKPPTPEPSATVNLQKLDDDEE
jgi:hypothetical protein